jgi:hypothetical protein
VFLFVHVFAFLQHKLYKPEISQCNVMKKSVSIRTLVLVVVFSVVSMATPFVSVFAQTTASPEYGVWEWAPLSQMSSSDMQRVVNEAAASHFTVIYTTIDEYLSIDALPDGSMKQQKLAAYATSVNQFLALAGAKGIAVDAEAGWRDWAVPGKTWQAYEIMNFVMTYNQGHATKFRGVQYDIEPYLLPQYALDEGSVLTQYVTLVAGLVRQDKHDNLPLGFDVPSFYTASAGATPLITVGGVTAYPYDQVLRYLNQLPRGRILLMAYRNFAVGPNGTINLSNDEIHLADSGTTKVIVGQETGPVTPSYVTFYGMTQADLSTQTGYVSQTFSGDVSFGGIAIDYLDYFMQLP